MALVHIVLAILVAIVWGVNFLFVKWGLEEISPLFLCTLRFMFASLPAILFIKPPAIRFGIVVRYGLVMFVLQFALFFIGMHAGMTPGMASLIMQVQVFFSMFFASIFLKDNPTSYQIFGALISFLGIGLVAFHFDQDVSFSGFILILGAAATWGFGNLITKSTKNINMMALVVWGSFVACFPLFLFTLIFEGWGNMVTSMQHISWKGGISVAYIVYASTWFGYGVWNFLLSRYPVSMVVPFTLLVPVAGIFTSVVFIGEPLQSWKILAGLLVISGLCINVLGARFFSAKVIPATSN